MCLYPDYPEQATNQVNQYTAEYPEYSFSYLSIKKYIEGWAQD